ncbi:hypothetical protein AAFF_G00148850 [Aldrovandia affinis]|uniref:Uncharacterized protein n=1 Tax=Aldrovandia affinis TaxID=143900 RepID=A0AAD7RS25_9TELE|nr:hypothetical protein AAFF_G00148850 [Aldrovandia affinis]
MRQIPALDRSHFSSCHRRDSDMSMPRSLSVKNAQGQEKQGPVESIRPRCACPVHSEAGPLRPVIKASWLRESEQVGCGWLMLQLGAEGSPPKEEQVFPGPWGSDIIGPIFTAGVRAHAVQGLRECAHPEDLCLWLVFVDVHSTRKIEVKSSIGRAVEGLTGLSITGPDRHPTGQYLGGSETRLGDKRRQDGAGRGAWESSLPGAELVYV